MKQDIMKHLRQWNDFLPLIIHSTEQRNVLTTKMCLKVILHTILLSVLLMSFNALPTTTAAVVDQAFREHDKISLKAKSEIASSHKNKHNKNNVIKEQENNYNDRMSGWSG